MALNEADREAVRPLIVPRCTGRVIRYALYLLNLPGDEAQMNWAREAIRSPNQFGVTASYHVTNDNAFIANGSSIGDETLGGAVEAALNAHVIPRYAPGPAPE